MLRLYSSSISPSPHHFIILSFLRVLCALRGKNKHLSSQLIEMIEKVHLIKIANTSMPFGKYKGKLLIDIPEDYLLWLANKGFPKGELGDLLSLVVVIKTEGIEAVVDPLRGMYPQKR